MKIGLEVLMAFTTDSLQFGFKCNAGCMDTIFTLKSVINHFIIRCYSVNAASPHTSKAFDKMSHSKPFNSLLAASLPLSL